METFAFDADSVLTYRDSGVDFVQACRDGETKPGTTAWGELPCNTTGATTFVCGNEGGGGEGGGGGGP